MSGPQRNPDSINTMTIVVIGICASVLVYVTVVALQAFYMKDTADVFTMADYGGTDNNYRSQKAQALAHINEIAANREKMDQPPSSYKVPIDIAMKKVVEDARAGKFSELVPGMKSDKATALPIAGKPQMLPSAADAGAGSPGAGSGSAAPADGGATGAGSADEARAGSGAQQVPTAGQAQGGGPAPQTGTNNTPAQQAPGNPAAEAGSAATKGNAP